jgi:Ran GTPase-activating protein (RanGAP) involved in mRNA processing and transport
MAVSQNSHLSVLKLAYNNLQDAGAATLASGIAAHKCLKLLDLGFNNIGDQGIRALATAMSFAQQQQQQGKSNSGSNTSVPGTTTKTATTTTACPASGSTLQTLYLAGNLIGQDGALAIADIIRLRSSMIEKLYLTGNKIGGEGVKAITEAIVETELSALDVLKLSDDEEMNINDALSTSIRNNPNVSHFRGMQELFLGGTAMGHTGCASVARLLESSTTLRVISLPNCDIDDNDVSVLAASIKLNKSRLPMESIQLSFNNISHNGAECLANALWGSTTLKELVLDNNKIGDRGAHHVAAIIPTLTALKVLDVGFNSVKTSGLAALMKTVAGSASLSSMSVSGNAVDVVAAKAIAYALAYNVSLKEMILVHCSIVSEGQRNITAGIVSNTKTALVKLTGIDIGRKSYLSWLTKALNKSCMLRKESHQPITLLHSQYRPFSDHFYTRLPRGSQTLDERANTELHSSNVGQVRRRSNR